jgi:hypothetical protein
MLTCYYAHSEEKHALQVSGGLMRLHGMEQVLAFLSHHRTSCLLLEGSHSSSCYGMACKVFICIIVIESWGHSRFDYGLNPVLCKFISTNYTVSRPDSEELGRMGGHLSEYERAPLHCSLPLPSPPTLPPPRPYLSLPPPPFLVDSLPYQALWYATKPARIKHSDGNSFGSGALLMMGCCLWIQRRCYWLLEGDDSIVFVHYLSSSLSHPAVPTYNAYPPPATDPQGFPVSYCCQ